MCAEYADALHRFPPHSLRAGIGKLIAERKEKFWPTPAEISEATLKAVVVYLPSRMESKPDDFKTRMAKEDARAMEARKAIIADFGRRNASLCRTADSEGWGGLLMRAVEKAANILEQRDTKRRKGEQIHYPCAFPDAHEPHIISIDRQEEISIPPKAIETWRKWIANPTAAHLKHAQTFKSTGGVAKRIVDDLSPRAGVA